MLILSLSKMYSEIVTACDATIKDVFVFCFFAAIKKTKIKLIQRSQIVAASFANCCFLFPLLYLSAPFLPLLSLLKTQLTALVNSLYGYIMSDEWQEEEEEIMWTTMQFCGVIAFLSPVKPNQIQVRTCWEAKTFHALKFTSLSLDQVTCFQFITWLQFMQKIIMTKLFCQK